MCGTWQKARDKQSLGASAFFTRLVLAPKYEPCWDIPTACTDGTTIRYNPEYVATNSKAVIVGLLAEEGGHSGFGHHVRMAHLAKQYGDDYDPKLANVAADLALLGLLKQAGLEKGFKTVLYVYNVDPNPRIAQAIQEDLSKIGIKVKLKNLAQANVIAAGGKPKTAPMIWSGGMAWIADFPDPSNFYGPILGSAGATNGGWNWSWYCNKELDARATKADEMSDPARAAERAQLWKAIFTDIMKDAPWVPIFNEQRFTMRSKRVGGADALYVDPVRIPINYDHIHLSGN
jgi:ABC-type transport system substrate-binding protein